MKASIYSAIKYLFLLIIGIFLLVMAFKGQDLEQLLVDLSSANYIWVLVSVLACLVAHILRAIRWGMLIETLEKRTPPVRNTFIAVMIGYLSNLAFPRMGEITRCGVIHKTDKIPLNQLIGTVIAERLIDLLMVAIITVMAIIFQYKLISEFIYKEIILKFTGEINYIKILFFVVILLFFGLSLVYILVKKNHWVVVQKLQSLWTGFTSGLFSVKKVRDKRDFIVYSLLIWLFYFLSTYVCFFSLDTLANLGPVVALSVLVFGSFGMIAPVQGGIGAFHWMVAEGLSIYSIARSDGLAYATIIHSSQVLLILFIGLISIMILAINSRKRLK